MALPTIKHKIYRAKLPSNGKELEYRPYTVKEESILLVAAESKSYSEMIDAVKQIINNCMINVDFDAVDMTQIDMEYMFLKLMTASKSNTLSIVFQNTKCPNVENSTEFTDPEYGTYRICKNKVKMSIVVDEIEIEQLNEELEDYIPYNAENFGYKEKGKQVMLDDDIGILLRYPGLKDLRELEEGDGDKTERMNRNKMMMASIKAVFDKQTVYSFTKEELETFFFSLSSEHKEVLSNFIDRVPVLRKKVPFNCKICGYKEDITLTGLKDFLE